MIYTCFRRNTGQRRKKFARGFGHIAAGRFAREQEKVAASTCSGVGPSRFSAKFGRGPLGGSGRKTANSPKGAGKAGDQGQVNLQAGVQHFGSGPKLSVSHAVFEGVHRPDDKISTKSTLCGLGHPPAGSNFVKGGVALCKWRLSVLAMPSLFGTCHKTFGFRLQHLRLGWYGFQNRKVYAGVSRLPST